MSELPIRHPMTLKPALLQLPGMDAVKVQRGLVYHEADPGSPTLDVWTPARAAAGVPNAAVVFVSGFPDPAFERHFGCRVMEMASYESWARLVAASGLVAVTYANREPAADFAAVLRYVYDHASELGVDRKRIAIWACSGNVPTALGALLVGAEVPIAGAALCYGYMFDAEAAASQIGFANPCAGRSIADVRASAPLLVVRAGQDQTPGLNATIDRFVAGALAKDLPLTLVNHAGAPHAFDLLDDTDGTREVIRAILEFLRAKLAPVA
jgi:dienelactone hydrolase